MKSMARSYVWWPSIDHDTENLAKSCSGCANKLNNPAKSQLHPRSYPTTAWERVHIDYAGPFQGHMYLLLQDAYSKWPEVAIMKSTSASATIDRLRSWFARFELPLEIVSDNGPQFSSEMFKDFCRKYGIKSHKSSPWHPSSNGQAERLVQSLKASLKGQKSETSDARQKLDKFLFKYRNSVHSTTNESPAVLLLGHPLRSKLDLLKPNLRQTVEQKQYNSPRVHDKLRTFIPGEEVLTRDYRCNDNKWQSGEVIQKTGPVSYHIRTSDGVVWRRHADQKLSSKAKTATNQEPVIPVSPVTASTAEETVSSEVSQPNPEQVDPPVKLPFPTPRRSTRVRQPPDRYGRPVLID